MSTIPQPQPDLTVTTSFGLDSCDISLAHSIEEQLDRALVACGFTRIGSTKAGDKLEFQFRQFGVCT